MSWSQSFRPVKAAAPPLTHEDPIQDVAHIECKYCKRVQRTMAMSLGAPRSYCECGGSRKDGGHRQHKMWRRLECGEQPILIACPSAHCDHKKQVSERSLELAHWCPACDPGAPIKKQHKWVDIASDACAAHQNVWDAMEFFCKSTGHGRFRDSSALSAAVAALAAAQGGVQPARATNCNATNDPLTALPSDSLPVKQAKRNLRNIVDSLQAEMCGEVVSHFDRVKSVSDCCDAVRDACVGQSPCAGCGCMSNRGGLKVLALGDAMLDGLLVPMIDLEEMQNTCKLVNECTWNDGSPMFKELNDGELAPFTVVKRAAEGAGGVEWLRLDRAGISGESAQMCASCLAACRKWAKANGNSTSGAVEFQWPSTMVVGGADYGNPESLGLAMDLKMTEKAVLSQVRVFDSIIKLRPTGSNGPGCVGQDGLKGHVVSFDHNAPDAITQLVLNTDGAWVCEFVDMLHVTFVGAKHIWGRLKSSGELLNSVSVRALEVVKWIVSLSLFHTSYTHLRESFFTRQDGEQVFTMPIDVVATQKHCDLQTNQLLSAATIADGGVASAMDDVAGAPLNVDSNFEQSAKGAPMNYEHVLLQNDCTIRNHSSPEVDLLRQTMKLCGHQVTVAAASDPISEFDHNDKIITGAFPHVFFLGKGVPTSGSVRKSTLQAWLNHHSMRFEHEAQLLFLLFNQMQRHHVCRDVSATVKACPKHVEAFNSMVAEPDFLQRLQRALDDPDTPGARKLVSEIEKLVRMSGRDVPFSPAQRHAAVSQLYSMVQFYGLPSWFVTVSPGEVNNKLVMTICDNIDWAAIDMEQVGDDVTNSKAPKKKPEFQWSMEFDYPDRARKVAENPVAAAKHFAALTEAIMKHLCKLECDHTNRKTCNIDNVAGALGKMIAHFGALESQGRGSLHFHAVMWSGLTPELLQCLATNVEVLSALKETAAGVLDSMASSKLPAGVHAGRGEDNASRLQRLNSELGPWTAEECTTLGSHSEHGLVNEADFNEAVQRNVVNMTNYHTHSATCRKGKYGCRHCRLAQPQPICDELSGQTGPIQLEKELLNDGDEGGGGYTVVAHPVWSEPPTRGDSLEAYLEDPLSPLDTRCVMWELGKGGVNGDGTDELVVPYSTSFSAAGACNTAIVPLGCSEQAKAVCYYVLKYITKDPTALEATRVLVFQAILHMVHHPSTAEDVGSGSRNTKHLLERMLNNMQGAQEVSSQMAATALLGKPPCFSSDSFWYAFIWPAIQEVRRHSQSFEQNVDGGEDDNIGCNADDENDTGPDLDILNSIERDQDVELHPSHRAETLASDELGSARTYRTQDENGSSACVLVAQHVHYIFRHQEMQEMNFHEFVSLIDIVQKSKGVRGKGQTGGHGGGGVEDSAQGAADEVQPDGSKGITGRGRKANGRCACKLVINNCTLLPPSPHACHQLVGVCRFEFREIGKHRHPMTRTHCMMLRSKRKVPILAGSPPPLLPANPNKATAAADRFASYMLVLLCPWVAHEAVEGDLPLVEVNGDKLRYQDFCEKMFEWETGIPQRTGGYVCPIQGGEGEGLTELLKEMGRSRAKFATNIARGLRVNTERKNTFTGYRYSQAKQWDDGDPTNPPDHASGPGSNSAGQEDPTTSDIAVLTSIAMRAVDRRANKHSAVESKQRAQLEALMSKLHALTPQSESLTHDDTRTHTAITPQWESIAQPTTDTNLILDNITAPLKDVSASQGGVGEGTEANQASAPATGGVQCEILNSLNSKQNVVYSRVESWHKRRSASAMSGSTDLEPLVLLVHGPPGAGKTRLADAIARSFACAAAAPTGVAATLFLDALTLHALLGLPLNAKGKMGPIKCINRLTELRNRLKQAHLLLVDEVSFIDPVTLHQIDMRCRELLQRPGVRFGGIGVVFFGDFFQLDPCFFGSLAKAVVDLHDEIHPKNQKAVEIQEAARTFSYAEKYELTEQHRCDDPKHNERLAQMRNATQHGPAISDDFLDSIRTLSSGDFNTDKEEMIALERHVAEVNSMKAGQQKRDALETLRAHRVQVQQRLWMLTPIAVTNNRLRHEINRHRGWHYAQATAQPIFKWNHKIVERVGDILHSGGDENNIALDELRTEFPELQGQFVAGAPGHLLFNLNPSKSYANGTPIVLHSLSFTEQDTPLVLEKIQQWRDAGSVPGAEIIVPVPETVNVQVPSVLASAENASSRIDTADCVQSDGTPSRCVVIPIPLLHKCPNTGAKKHFELKLTSTKHKLKYEAHPITISFAMTYHKLQGQTRAKIILDFNQPAPHSGTLTLKHMYVGMSRVTSGKGLRVLPYVDEHSSKQHIRSKRVCEKLTRYLSGFDGDGTKYAGPHGSTPTKGKRAHLQQDTNRKQKKRKRKVVLG